MSEDSSADALTFKVESTFAIPRLVYPQTGSAAAAASACSAVSSEASAVCVCSASSVTASAASVSPPAASACAAIAGNARTSADVTVSIPDFVTFTSSSSIYVESCAQIPAFNPVTGAAPADMVPDIKKMEPAHPIAITLANLFFMNKSLL